MSDPSWYSEATLVAADGHVFCAGTLIQCIRRWGKLSDDARDEVSIRMGRDGVPPVVLKQAEIDGLARAVNDVKV